MRARRRGLEPESRARLAAEKPRRSLYLADSARLLRILAEHQFEDPFQALRELYANALDAVRGRPEAKIVLCVTAESVVVEDNGPGLDSEGLGALTTLGASTRRGQDAIGRFGLGFASLFNPELGLHRVEFRAARPQHALGFLLRFVPAGGRVLIEQEEARSPPSGGSRVELFFDPERAPKDRVARALSVLELHAAYSGVETELNGRRLGKHLSNYVEDELACGGKTPSIRALMEATSVRGPSGVAAIDPTAAESKFRAYQQGLFVTEVPLPPGEGARLSGVFGAVQADGLELVASRNDFVHDERFANFQAELVRLSAEAGHRLVLYFEATRDALARVILLDALRRGLRKVTPEALLSASDVFSRSLVRAPLFPAWGTQRHFAFETLVSLARTDTLRFLPHRPFGREPHPILQANEPVEREILGKLSGLPPMPSAARAEPVSAPSLLSRLLDRLLFGPRAEYSLFQKELAPDQVFGGSRRLVAAVETFLARPEVAEALARLLPGPMPRIGLGLSRNVFGPVAAFHRGEIRLNVAHRAIRRLSSHDDPHLAARALLPVLAHELAHVCHELHDLDFYRTSRAMLRALATAAVRIDALESAPLETGARS